MRDMNLSGRFGMKKLTIFLLLAMPVVGALALNLSCSATTPTAANNLQNAIGPVVTINPPLTATFTNTVTPTFTVTPTGTPTSTSTPYVTATPWTGFNAPAAVAVDGSGNVYVADTGNNRVAKYNSNGVLAANWGYGGVKGKIPYTHPLGVASNAAGTTLFVVGNGNLVSEYGPQGNLQSFSPSITFSNPQGVAVDNSTGNIFIADTGNNRIVQLNSSGVTTGFTNGPGPVTGVLNLAASVTIGSVTITSAVTLTGIAVNGGNVYVATQGTGVNGSSFSSVLGFDIATGNTTTIAIPGFANPTGIAFDPNNNLYVADTGNKQIEEYSAGSFTQIPMSFNDSGMLVSPKGIAVDSGSNVYVTDSSLNEVVKFAP